MEAAKALLSSSLALLLLLFSANACVVVPGPYPGSYSMSFYVWLVRLPTPTETVNTVPLTGEHPEFKNFTFGYASALDNKITVEKVYDSTECGRSQGFYIVSSLSGTTATFLLTNSFTKYPGSYITTSGKFDFTAVKNTLTIDQGTGFFYKTSGIYDVTLVANYGPKNASMTFYGTLTYYKST